MLSDGFALLGQIDRSLAALAAASLLPLACYILVSGLDDLSLDLAAFYRSVLQRLRPRPSARATIRTEQPIAIFIPCWHEADVIGDMLRHNLASISYSNYEIFAGAYPNDPKTIAAVQQVQATHPRLHLALVPHDGPTSKADCLNWIYQRMLLWEEETQRTIAIVVIHDAEDIIHPASFDLFNRHAAEGYGMIQLPVLALPTPFLDLTHGVYCDDFAESQGKDLETRNRTGAFVPGCGVGTAFRRDALDRLAQADANRIFQPGSLTEDYDNGLRFHMLGVRQLFVPLTFERGAPLATREFFPRRFRQAVRQRSRWVTGNALQAWERFGWGRSIQDAWFLWRDRKGLWGNPISLYCNLLLLYGLTSWAAGAALGHPWPLRELVKQSPVTDRLLYATTALFASRIVFRTAAVARIYGWAFALGVPVRMIWGNVINCAATARALFTWTRARLFRRPLVWVKTEHAYPTRGALLAYKRLLGEILTGNGYCSQSELQRALATRREGQRLGERLMEMGVLSEDELYEALSLQQSLPTVNPSPVHVSPRIARALPARVLEDFRVLPFRIEHGEIHVAGPDIPDDHVQQMLQGFTRLELRFHLITPSNYAALRAAVFA